MRTLRQPQAVTGGIRLVNNDGVTLTLGSLYVIETSSLQMRIPELAVGDAAGARKTGQVTPEPRTFSMRGFSNLNAPGYATDINSVLALFAQPPVRMFFGVTPVDRYVKLDIASVAQSYQGKNGPQAVQLELRALDPYTYEDSFRNKVFTGPSGTTFTVNNVSNVNVFPQLYFKGPGRNARLTNLRTGLTAGVYENFPNATLHCENYSIVGTTWDQILGQFGYRDFLAGWYLEPGVNTLQVEYQDLVHLSVTYQARWLL